MQFSKELRPPLRHASPTYVLLSFWIHVSNNFRSGAACSPADANLQVNSILGASVPSVWPPLLLLTLFFSSLFSSFLYSPTRAAARNVRGLFKMQWKRQHWMLVRSFLSHSLVYRRTWAVWKTWEKEGFLFFPPPRPAANTNWKPFQMFIMLAAQFRRGASDDGASGARMLHLFYFYCRMTCNVN